MLCKLIDEKKIKHIATVLCIKIFFNVPINTFQIKFLKFLME